MNLHAHRTVPNKPAHRMMTLFAMSADVPCSNKLPGQVCFVSVAPSGWHRLGIARRLGPQAVLCAASPQSGHLRVMAVALIWLSDPLAGALHACASVFKSPATLALTDFTTSRTPVTSCNTKLL